jgi:predicted DCC family thiol-disulfide oxidoreductase YuxK
MSIEAPLAATVTPQARAADGPVVFFDGVCGLCNGAVDWLLAHDRRAALRFAPLQGVTASERGLTPRGDATGWSMVLVDAQGEHRGSSAALRTVRHIGGVWGGLAGAALIVPRPLREWVYRLVAGNRYRWFGRRDACRMPSVEERGRFLP